VAYIKYNDKDWLVSKCSVEACDKLNTLDANSDTRFQGTEKERCKKEPGREEGGGVTGNDVMLGYNQ